MGFITDIENMPNEYAYSKCSSTVVPATEHGDRDRRGRDADQVLQRVEKHWADGNRAEGHSDPKEPPPPARCTSTAMGERDAPYVAVASRSCLGETSKDSAAMDILAASTSARHPSCTRSSSSRAESRALDSMFRPASIPRSSQYLPGQNAADALYVRDQILGTISSARAALLPRSA